MKLELGMNPAKIANQPSINPNLTITSHCPFCHCSLEYIANPLTKEFDTLTYCPSNDKHCLYSQSGIVGHYPEMICEMMDLKVKQEIERSLEWKNNIHAILEREA